MGFMQRIAEIIIRSSGQQVSPNLLAAVTANGKKGEFGKVLNGLQSTGASQGLQVPTPPQPPADLKDPEAQRKYNEALLLYNQQFQAYHTRMVSMFMQRFQAMQQAMIQTQRNSQPGSAGNQTATLGGGRLGVGGILGKDSDI